MEDIYNDELDPQQENAQSNAVDTPREPESQPYSGAGVGYRETIFENTARQETSAGEKSQNNNVPPVQPPIDHAPLHSQKPQKPHKPRRRVWRTVLAAGLTLVLVAGSCGLTAWVINDRWNAELQRTNESLTEQIQQLQKQITAASTSDGVVSGSVVSADRLTPSQVYSANVSSVVLISSQVQTSYFGQTTTGTSTGSGFILTENGYVVTNYHVVEGASSVSVTTYEGEEYGATVVGYDSTNDVAVLKIDAQNLPAVKLGSSDDLIVGDQVVAIGNPLGELTSTMTVGYVSAKDREVTTDGTTINMIQTDAAINSGNSGGPLFNMQGEVVGITTAKYSGSSSSGASIESIGFAIPIDDVSSMIDDLMNYGYITGAYLGVGVTDVDSTAQMYGVPGGAYVKTIEEDNCAKKAGVQIGDIIIGVGDYSVGSYSDLSRALRKFKAGDTTTITVYRSGQELTLPITLDEKPHEEAADMPENGTYDEWYKYFFGNGKDAG